MIFLAVMTIKQEKSEERTLHSAEHNVHNCIIFYTERFRKILKEFNTLFFPPIKYNPGDSRASRNPRGAWTTPWQTTGLQDFRMWTRLCSLPCIVIAWGRFLLMKLIAP